MLIYLFFIIFIILISIIIFNLNKFLSIIKKLNLEKKKFHLNVDLIQFQNLYYHFQYLFF